MYIGNSCGIYRNRTINAMTEYEGEVRAGMLVYVLSEEERKSRNYDDLFAICDTTHNSIYQEYPERIKEHTFAIIESVERPSGKNERYRLKYKNWFVYTKKDIIILGFPEINYEKDWFFTPSEIAKEHYRTECLKFIKRIFEESGVGDRGFAFNSSKPKFYYAISDKSTSRVSVEELKTFLNILSKKDDESELQREESPVSGTGGPKQCRICCRRHEAKIVLGHLSNQARAC